VTGASGLVGAEVASVAAAAGYDIIGLGHSHRAPPAFGGMSLDLTAASALETLRDLQPLSAVAHCAAAVPPSFTGPAAERVARANEQMDSCIVEFCRARGIRLVYCSTVAVYGEVAGALVDESTPTNPVGPYALEKLRAERHVRETLPSYAILRICAPYGPAQRQRTVLRIFIERALAGEELQYLGSGLRQQDFLHVHDAALAVLRAIERRDVSGVFNVCGGAPICMRALAHLILKETGSERCAAASGDADPQEDYRARFDIGRAAGALGWRPTIPVAEGVRRMIDALRHAS
jgi:UDP-glucose 4-epimerase